MNYKLLAMVFAIGLSIAAVAPERPLMQEQYT